MKAEFIEDIYIERERERERQKRSVWETGKGKEHESPLCLGSGVFNGDWSGARVLLGIQELVRARTGARCPS